MCICMCVLYTHVQIVDKVCFVALVCKTQTPKGKNLRPNLCDVEVELEGRCLRPAGVVCMHEMPHNISCRLTTFPSRQYGKRKM